MSTSDSDYSIDWLASDEDDYDSPERLSPQPPQSSTTASLRESPSSCFHSSAATQRRRSDCKDGGRFGGVADSPAPLETPALSPVQGFTSVCKQQTLLSVESKHHAVRKRAHSAALDELCEKPQPDTENQLFSHKVRSFLLSYILFVQWTDDNVRDKYLFSVLCVAFL